MTITIDSFLDYLKVERRYSSHTITAYRKDLKDFLEFNHKSLNGKSIANIESQDVRHWLGHLSNQALDHRTINRKISALKSYFKYLNKTKQRDDNPMLGHHTLKTSKRVMTPLSIDEMRRLFEDVHFSEDYSGRRDKLILDLLYCTGMRRAELIGLSIGDIDLDLGSVKVLGKRNKERIIPLTNSIVKEILTYLSFRLALVPYNNDSLFLTDKGNMLYPQFVYNVVRKYLAKVTTKKYIGPHILRHTFATHLLERGANLNGVKDLLGHSSLAATQIYTHSNINELKKVYQKTHPRQKK